MLRLIQCISNGGIILVDNNICAYIEMSKSRADLADRFLSHPSIDHRMLVHSVPLATFVTYCVNHISATNSSIHLRPNDQYRVNLVLPTIPPIVEAYLRANTGYVVNKCFYKHTAFVGQIVFYRDYHGTN